MSCRVYDRPEQHRISNLSMKPILNVSDGSPSYRCNQTDQIFSSSGMSQVSEGRNTRMQFLKTVNNGISNRSSIDSATSKPSQDETEYVPGRMRSNPSTPRQRPAPRETQTEYRSPFNAANLGSAASQRYKSQSLVIRSTLATHLLPPAVRKKRNMSQIETVDKSSNQHLVL